MGDASSNEFRSDLAPGAKELLSAAYNVNSQIGEDGIIKAILGKFNDREKWCVEFGAWDGKYLCNTRRLIDEEGYSAVLIEANPKTYKVLADSFATVDRVHCLQAFVGYDKHDNLDALLDGTGCPKNFDFLSIDIDGNDIHVWEAIERYRPKLICIEYNPTIPTSVSFAQPKDPNIKWGSSVRAMFEMGLKTRYKLVCANEWNGFFVAEEYWDGPYAKTVEDLPHYRKVEPVAVHLFSGYDGTVLLSGTTTLNWHGIAVEQGKVQLLPRFLRRYPDDYNWLQNMVLKAGRKLRGRARSIGIVE